MADVVQYRLERMVDELEDLEEKGIFTHQELAEIVKKRRKFEYRIKSPSPPKQDYLDYIEFEKNFDKLRYLRKKSISRELVKQGENKLKRSVSDRTSKGRIIHIYRLATRRFKGDLDLWFQYIDFCKEHDHKRMQKLLPQVIRLHPKVPGVWIKAAAWEFDHNLNVPAARVTMQMGKRSCPESEDLCVEYLRMELTYLNKLKARKAELGEGTRTLTRTHVEVDEQQWRDENKDSFMAFDKEKEETDAFQEIGSSVIRTVYSDAVKALPFSMSLRKRFLEILNDLDVAQSENLKEEILDSMKRDFARQPDYWDWLARHQVNDLKGISKSKEDLLAHLDKAVAIYEEALKIVPSAKLFTLYIKFWMDVIAPELEDSPISGFARISDHAAELAPHLLKVYEKAESMGCLAENLACQYISFYLQLGRLEEARNLAEKLCKGNISEAVKLWLLRLSIEMEWITKKSPSKADLHSTFKLVQNILENVPISDADSLWLTVIKYYSSNKKRFDKLLEIFMKGLIKGTAGASLVSSDIVHWVLEKDGIHIARDMYKRFLSLTARSRALFENCIRLESNLALAGDKDALVHARKLYVSALDTYHQDVGLWRNYLSLEQKVGTSETAGAVHTLARKTLNDSSSLMDY